MTELEEAWEIALAQAARRARAAGRKDIESYLTLRAANDLLRKTGVEWLINGFVALAGQANRKRGAIQITQSDGHRFAAGTATMVGPMLTLKHGVRTLIVEAGWPRTPKDGFLRGGGLAHATVRHLGLERHNNTLRLVKSAKPHWIITNRHSALFDESKMKAHLRILLDETH